MVNKKVIVTGGNRGIGKGIVLSLLDKGYSVLATSRDSNNFDFSHSGLKIADLDVLEPLVWQYEMDNPRKSEKFSDYNYWLSQFHLMRGWHDRAFKTGQASMRIAPDIQWYKKFYDQLRAAVAKVNEDHSTGKTE